MKPLKGLLIVAASIAAPGCTDEVVGPERVPGADFAMAGTSISTFDFSPIADVQVSRAQPKENRGFEEFLEIGGGPEGYGLMAFDETVLRETLAGGSALTAVLELSIAELHPSTKASTSFGIYRVLVPWTEGGATWRCPNSALPGAGVTENCPGGEWDLGAPGFLAQQPAALFQAGDIAGNRLTIDVRALIQEMLADPAPHHGWAIRMEGPARAGGIRIQSRESDQPPRLVVSGSFGLVIEEPIIACGRARLRLSPETDGQYVLGEMEPGSCADPLESAYVYGRRTASGALDVRLGIWLTDPLHVIEPQLTFTVPSELPVSGPSGTSSIAVVDGEPTADGRQALQYPFPALYPGQSTGAVVTTDPLPADVAEVTVDLVVHGNPRRFAAWAVQVDGRVSNTSVVAGPDGSTYFGTYDVDPGHVYRISPDGVIEWDVHFSNMRISQGTHLAVGGDGTIYGVAHAISSSADLMFALSPAGIIKWQVPANGFRPTGGPLLLPDGNVVFAGGGTIQARGPDGSLGWEVTLPAGNNVRTGAVATADGTVYAYSSINGTLHALSSAGASLWTVAGLDTGPEVGGVLAVDGEGGVIVQAIGRWRRISSAGERRSDLVPTFPSAEPMGPIAVGSTGRMIGLAPNYTFQDRTYPNRVCAFDADGGSLWCTQMQSNQRFTPLIADDGTAWIMNWFLYQVSLATGEILQRIGGSYHGSPILEGGLLRLVTRDGVIAVYASGSTDVGPWPRFRGGSRNTGVAGGAGS